MSRRHKDLFINIFLSIFSIGLVLLLLETVTRWVYRNTFTNHYDFRLSRPEPYHGSEYFSEDFIKESFRQPGRWINPPGTRILYPDNFRGRFFTVTEHCRRTTNTPEKFLHRIYLFGGSTMYCSEVPDTHTIASYLQRMLNLSFPHTYKVINMGATSINTAQQLERLQTISLDSGDIVCFYGGVNDGLLFTTGRVNGWIMGENYIEYSTKLNLIQKFSFHLYEHLKEYSRFAELFLNPFSYQIPPHLQDSFSIDSLKKKLYHSYFSNIQKAHAICHQNSAMFINFLQPHLFTKKVPSPYEKELMQNKYLIPPPWIIALKHSYPVLQEACKNLSAAGVVCADLTATLNQQQESYYLDFCHVTEKANAFIAEKIYQTIVLSLSKK